MKTKVRCASIGFKAFTHFIWIILAGCGFAAGANASDIPLMFQAEVLAKAAPDECFFGLGNTNNAFSSTGIVCQACLQAGGKPKVNQGYVWGLTRAGDDFWIGTGPNVNSLVAGMYLGMTNPAINSAYAAEYGLSALVRAGLVPPALGDWRPPNILVLNLQNRSLVLMDTLLPGNAKLLLQHTLGLRSAGTSAPTTANTNGVVILAGPSLSPATGGGIVMFAFDAATRAFIGAHQFPQYSNIRKWLLNDGVLYTAVTFTNGGGCVLRWVSDPGDSQYPFAFTVVGNLDNGGSELAVHEGRLFVATWPGIEGQAQVDFLRLMNYPAGLYMSPVIPAGGLTASHANQWSKVWSIKNYETDTVIAAVTAMGALHSFGGYLYWGTLNVPDLNFYAHSAYFGAPATSNDMATVYSNVRRAVSIFRASNFVEGYPPSVELLYGETNLISRNMIFRNWQTTPNAMGTTPQYGPSGFGNRHNLYTWTMEVYKDRLFVGTMNESGAYQAPRTRDGAGLFCFETTNAPARAVTQHGLDNYANYGIRTMLSDSNSLYLGMANPMNLMTDTNGGKPLGGWELDRLTKIFNDQDWDNLEDAWETNYFGHAGVSSSDDPDHDGMNNSSEFIAGTNPTNSQDVLAITNAVFVSDALRLSWPGHAGRTYHITQSSSLTGPWTASGTVTGSNSPVSFSVPNITNRSQFFRLDAQLAPPP